MPSRLVICIGFRRVYTNQNPAMYEGIVFSTRECAQALPIKELVQMLQFSWTDVKILRGNMHGENTFRISSRALQSLQYILLVPTTASFGWHSF